MDRKTDISYGIIPYRYEDGVPRFLLVFQHSRWRGDTYWVFPKGHPEEGESPEATARRELYEETQIELNTLDTEHPITISYAFEHDGQVIDKQVVYFPGKAARAEFMLDEHEVTDAGWFTYEEARKRLSFENTKKVLDAAVKYLQTI